MHQFSISPVSTLRNLTAILGATGLLMLAVSPAAYDLRRNHTTTEPYYGSWACHMHSDPPGGEDAVSIGEGGAVWRGSVPTRAGLPEARYPQEGTAAGTHQVHGGLPPHITSICALGKDTVMAVAFAEGVYWCC